MRQLKGPGLWGDLKEGRRNRERRPMLRLSRLSVAVFIFLIATIEAGWAENRDWTVHPVWVWDPPFSMSSPRKQQTYSPLKQASKKWRLCVTIPHLKDAYWYAVNYGLVDQARRLDVSLKMFEAGGYENLEKQMEQIAQCLALKPDALIVSAVDLIKVNPALEKAHALGVPIIDLINGIDYPHLSARSAADYYDDAFAIGKYIVEQHIGSNRIVNVLWFPGPKGAGWVDRGDKGFKDAIRGTNINVLDTYYGDTGKKTQGELVETALVAYPDADLIVGTTVTAEAAVGIVRRKRLKGQVKIYAYYFGPGVHRELRRGTIVAAPSDLQTIQGRIAVDQAVRILEGKPYLKHVGPVVKVVDRSSLADFDLLSTLAPKGFKATFDVN